jgi:L-lysine exporter family protein LysE/ArgO
MTFSATLLPALLGLSTGLALIIAIGAQNAFVLRLGIEGQNRIVVPVVAICAASDAILIAAGILGIGAVVQAAPLALVGIRVVGSGFLIVYGLFAAARMVRPSALKPVDSSHRVGLKTAVATIVVLTWLNPHVYLDTIVFLGSVGNQQGPDQRWWWAAGAMTASVVWFFGLGLGARLLRPVFAKPNAWRVLDGVIAVVMIGLGVRMALGV